MRFEQVSILGVAHVDAPHVVTSQEIEERLAGTLERLGMKPNQLRDVSGIEQRRVWDEGFQPSDAAARAGERAIDIAGIDRNDLGVLINTSVCRDYVEPSTACIAHANLGLPETCMNFDLGNACLAFINGMDMVSNMIERGQIDYGIVVNGESSRLPAEKTIERLSAPDVDEAVFRANFATLTLGSGAAAMVLGRSTGAQGEHRFLGGFNLAATEHCRLCYGQVDGMTTNTRELLVQGLGLASKTWKRAAEEYGWTVDDFDHFVLHQVSRTHTEKFAEIIGLDLEKVYRLYPRFGNIGPAGVPIVLSKLQEEGKLIAGQRVALMGIGSGLNCTMAEVVW
ncbi:MAG: 3-oxoacyl-ACP synthase III [Thermoanaerobaculales bacterium]|jgi:3-oxoacyl-[acyl-carrier-protein] synthase-3|nr:3-oxoacyl-ACP synthase III [Thermoanaerobaculales bacterium]